MTGKIDLEKYKSSTFRSTINSLLQKHDLKDGNIGQNEALSIIKKEKEYEKDKDVIADYSLIEEAIKNFFANKLGDEIKTKKFNARIAQETIIRELAKNKILQRVKDFATKYEDMANKMKKLAEDMLGKNFVNEIDNKCCITKQTKERKQAQNEWQNNLPGR